MRKTDIELGKVSWWTYARLVTSTTLSNADTLTIRILLANASFLWALGLIYDPSVFQRPIYQEMRDFGSAEVWAAAFFAHWLGVYWRIYDPKRRPRWALIVNTWGFVIWALCTISLTITAAVFTPTTALEWTLCVASAWALYRTGLNEEFVTP